MSEIEYCHPRDDNKRRWLLIYDDVDVPTGIYYTESDALIAYNRANTQYNCHLFTSVVANTLPFDCESLLNRLDLVDLLMKRYGILDKKRTKIQHIAANPPEPRLQTIQDRLDEKIRHYNKEIRDILTEATTLLS